MPKTQIDIETPALVLDLNILERNIAHMARFARENGIGLRPHAKTHKSAEIARRQIEAGALGVCAAKLGEAEALRAEGIESLLITSPIVTDAGIRRLIALNERSNDIMAVCDNEAVARRLAMAARASGKPLRLLVDLDPGGTRTGVVPGKAGLALVDFVVAQEILSFAGVQCYLADAQHMASRRERRDRSLAAWRKVGAFLEELAHRGIEADIVSGGGTGTFDIDPETKLLTELQAGSYIFMDRSYNDIWDLDGERPPFETSLFVRATVISVDHGSFVTADAGYKAFSTDQGAPVIVSGAPTGAHYSFSGDEHGKISVPDGCALPSIGDVITCVVPHCDPTVNLYDSYHVMRGERLEAVWPIHARGRSA